MSNETKYVRILPSAVGSEYGWNGNGGEVWAVKQNGKVLLISRSNKPNDIAVRIERIHTEPVYVSTEPPKVDEIFAEFNKPSGRTAAEYVGSDSDDLKEFIKAAMQGLLASDGGTMLTLEELATDAVEYATATLNALKNQQP